MVGGGVGGLTAALALARAGRSVVVLEQDELPDPADPGGAFAAARRGAPQVHQTHAFLARMRLLLAEHFPDVLDALVAAGCFTLPTTANLGEPRPGDDELEVLVLRRTTLEWVLRRTVAAEPSVTLVPKSRVDGLAFAPGAPPAVTGVRLAGDATLPAAAVVVATGRRGPLPEWLAAAGITLRESLHESGLVYLTRWYRLPDGFDVHSLDPRLAGDLGYVKHIGVPGDGGTLSVTLAVAASDRPLRRALADPARFERACRMLPGPDQYFRLGPLAPLGPVRPMGGLCNRRRRFLDAEGRPVVLGLHAVGDAHTCTNPLYGRGCTLAILQAVHLAGAFRAHPDDPVARARAYESACERDVVPWYRQAVRLDRMGAETGLAGTDGSADALAAVLAASRTDPVLGRGLIRLFNLLTTEAELAADPEFAARAAAAAADPQAAPAQDGPDREELLRALREETVDA